MHASAEKFEGKGGHAKEGHVMNSNERQETVQTKAKIIDL